MKHLKSYIDIKNSILPGYYVILIPEQLRGYEVLDEKYKKKFENFIKNNAGIVGSFHHTRDGYKILNINYENEPPKNIKPAFLYDFTRKQYYVSAFSDKVLEFGRTKEELELKLQSNKYNL